MAKRTAAVANLDRLRTLRSAKKGRMNATHFRLLDLPTEIRCMISDFAFDELRTAPLSPHAIYKSDLSTYCALRLTNKQLAAEVKYIFNLRASSFTFFVDNVPRIYDLLEASESIPALRKARFDCRADDEGRPQERQTRFTGFTSFIALQHAWSRREVEDFAGHDSDNTAASQGLNRYMDLLRRTRRNRTQKPDYTMFDCPDIGSGLSFTCYKFENVMTPAAPLIARWVLVVSGRLGDLLMDKKANIDSLRF